MFRCQFSNEISSPAVWKTESVSEQKSEGNWTEKLGSKYVRVLVTAAEKPVKVVIETRRREYNNEFWSEENGREAFTTYGTEIVKELTIRARHLDAVKKKYGLE